MMMMMANMILSSVGLYMILSNPPSNWFYGGLLILLGTLVHIQDSVIMSQREKVDTFDRLWMMVREGRGEDVRILVEKFAERKGWK